MLEKKITVETKTVVDGKEIYGHRAIINKGEVTLLPYQIDKAMCKEHRKAIREDANEFEDYAYDLQEKLEGN